MEIVDIEIKRLYANKGQLEGVPRNPRKWEKDELKNLAVSLKETPELFQMRPCIVAQYNDGFVVLGGNMRLAAATMNHDDTCPCIVVPNDMSAEKMCEIVAKDNGAFGEWDVEALTKDWNDKPLKDWGVKTGFEEETDLNPDDLDDKFSLKSGPKEAIQQMTFTVSDSQAEMIRSAICEIQELYSKYCEYYDGNTNKNGNALAKLVELWEGQKK